MADDDSSKRPSSPSTQEPSSPSSPPAPSPPKNDGDGGNISGMAVEGETDPPPSPPPAQELALTLGKEEGEEAVGGPPGDVESSDQSGEMGEVDVEVKEEVEREEEGVEATVGEGGVVGGGDGGIGETSSGGDVWEAVEMMGSGGGGEVEVEGGETMKEGEAKEDIKDASSSSPSLNEAGLASDVDKVPADLQNDNESPAAADVTAVLEPPQSPDEEKGDNEVSSPPLNSDNANDGTATREAESEVTPGITDEKDLAPAAGDDAAVIEDDGVGGVVVAEVEDEDKIREEGVAVEEDRAGGEEAKDGNGNLDEEGEGEGEGEYEDRFGEGEDRFGESRGGDGGEVEEIREVTTHPIATLRRDQLASDVSKWYRKTYMGGFRNRQTGVEYFNASSQTPTPQEIKAAAAAPKFHRDTQTKFVRNRRTQTIKEASTQMGRSDLHVTTEPDYTIQPKPYFTSDQHRDLLIRMATRIQCFVRKCFAIRLVRRLKRERDDRVRMLADKDKRRRELAEKRRRKEIESRLHPKSGKDFEILYNGLENWRIQETEKINEAGYSEPARLAALADLLDQEAALIQKIDRLKLAAADENRERSVVKLLEQMAAPKKWPTAKGAPCFVDTPNTVRARELRDLYHALNLAQLTIDERLQILLHVKYTVKEFDCNLSREIVELIDREGDLVSRGRDAKSLDGLRRRIGNLFLQFIQTPEFNPEAAHYQKFPGAGQAWKRDQSVYYCRSCTKYKPSTDFYLSTTMKHLGRCKPCTTKENIAHHRQDDTVFSSLLRSMRIAELQRRPETGVPHDLHYNALALLQESDMRYLVDAVWNRQSCISGARNIEDLVFTRWDRSMELSPWNCVLLTKVEADSHERQVDFLGVYSDDFVRRIAQKHLTARRHFAQLPAMERYLKRHYFEDREGRLMPRPVPL
ncbi:hypothetical protein HDU67_006235 [Dinochytrium kinnereticum]|nr:hypothetical protein HDU67_006235 [Dinochytrium kinnereticum]